MDIVSTFHTRDFAVTMATPRSEPPQPSPLPSRNPLPLSSAQEAQVRELYYKRVRGKCANEIRGKQIIQLFLFEAASLIRRLDFASCATNRTISATWACRKQRLAMNSCMVQYASQKEQDAAREEWFDTMNLRRLEMEEKQRRKAEAERFFKEWWDISESSNPKIGETAEKD